MNSRKIFFIKPNSVIQKEMVGELIRQGYEVYLVSDVDKAKRVFEMHPDCIAFLNIDEGLSEQGWEDFIAEVQADPRFADVKLGILTYNLDASLAEKYLMEYRLPCGFIKLSLGLAESTQIVLKVLEANEARGRRRYLRVECPENTKLNFMTQFGTVEGNLVDLSVVGMSCTLDPDKEWRKHSVIERIQLQLKGSLVLVDGIVMGSRMIGHERHYIILFRFDAVTAAPQKEKIRVYLQWALQQQIDTVLRKKPVSIRQSA